MDRTDKGTAHRWLLGTNETGVGRSTSLTFTPSLVCGCVLNAIRKPVPSAVPVLASQLFCALLQRRKRPVGDVVVGVITRVSTPAASMTHPSALLPLIRPSESPAEPSFTLKLSASVIASVLPPYLSSG